MTMPFGKYRGCLISELPDDYLDWLTTIDLRPRLRQAVEAEIDRRADARSHTAAPGMRPCPEPSIADEIVNAGLKVVARRYHPDVGGTHAQMIAATAAADWLRGVVRGLAC